MKQDLKIRKKVTYTFTTHAGEVFFDTFEEAAKTRILYQQILECMEEEGAGKSRSECALDAAKAALRAISTSVVFNG